ncbi:MAG: P22 phage major capsid protein family protein [Prochloraceae cyanobacterium]|nr:P22 phage major capsid protein family protein [Prochloraceae cyanobacterium]
MVVNVIQDIVPSIRATGAAVLRAYNLFPNLINSSYSVDARQPGSAVEVSIPPTITTRKVVPGNIHPASTPFTVGSVPIVLDFFEESEFGLPEDELGKIQNREVSSFTQSAAVSIVQAANTYTINKMYKRSYNVIGDVATTPFENGTTSYANRARRVLDENLAPNNDRYLVLDLFADEKASSLDLFLRVNESGTDLTLRTGEIGTKLGFSWWRTQLMPRHESAPGLDGAYQIDSTTHAIDDTQVTISQVGGAPNVDFVEGDIFTVAGDAQTYVVTKTEVGVNSGDLTLQYLPKAKTAFADDAIISVIPTHTVSLAFHRNSTGFANRLLFVDEFQHQMPGKIIEPVRDPESGLTMTYLASPQYYQTSHAYSILCGAAVIRPEHIVRIIGNPNPA